ncbi:MAG: NAD(P)H-dependent oxidoreductase subunit E [Dehalococcoidales bacterium]|nr:NAD(P)H-dependent oxidoreductase subunit E [Dehalococcoidales bacterium]
MNSGETRRLRRILRRFAGKKANLIPILQEIQGALGYLPRQAIAEIAHHLRIPEVDVYSVATFYRQFRLNPPGRHTVRVCLGLSLIHI